MRWDRLFRALVLGGTAMSGGITPIGCSRDTVGLQSTSDANDGGGEDRSIPREGADARVSDARSDAGDVFIPREGPAPIDTGVTDATSDAGDTGEADAGDAFIPREGPAFLDSGTVDSGADDATVDSGIPREGPPPPPDGG